MAYNINSIKIISGELILSVASQEMLREGLSEATPESCFLYEEDAKECFDNRCHFKHVWWHGKGSGNTYDHFLEALEETEGCADLLICWEGGDQFSGLRVTDGKVVEHAVVHVLGGETT